MEKSIVHTNHSSILDKAKCERCGFHLILFSDADEMYNLWLPQIPEGFYSFSNCQSLQFLNILARDGHWVAVCKKPAFFQNVPLAQDDEVILLDGQLLKIDVEDQIYSLYVEAISAEQLTFYNYALSSDGAISIGSNLDNDICYMNPHVSAKHAVLQRINGQWRIQSCGYTDEIYINGEKQAASYLGLGDIIFIWGLRIVIGLNFVSVNGGDKIIINKNTLRDLLPTDIGYSRYSSQDVFDENSRYFNRPPRKCIKIENQIIEVEGPPIPLSRAQLPLVLRMGSSMVMGGSAALAGNFMMLLTMVLFPLLSSKYTDKQRQEYEALRTTKYQEYLGKKQAEIMEVCKEEQHLLNEKYPELSVVASLLKDKLRLWERRPVDDDFLCIRLGTGEKCLGATISYPEKRFELEQDELEEKMYRMVETPYVIRETPVLLSLIDTYICALEGSRNELIEYISKLIFQIAALHSYDEVKMLFLLRQEELAQLNFLRYLPHVWDDQQSFRFIATNEAEAYKLGEYMKAQITEELEDTVNLHKVLRQRPYYLVFDLDKKLFESHVFFTDILRSEQNHGVSSIVVHESIPKETQKIITLEGNKNNKCTSLIGNDTDDVSFSIDNCSHKTIMDSLHSLANLKIKAITRTKEMPQMITFMEMLGVGRVEQLNSPKRWQDNNPAVSLAAPIGVEEDGSLFVLDLHEKRHGPHGIVAGMTGSGKSEFIITYILSMAVNYHPDEVAFVLIDYKGGGLAGAFDNPETGVRLPHLVGTITNLDGASINRSLQSIESELLRRQNVFNKVKSIANEGTMDIYEYQKMYRAGKVSEAMPHLFIISDEFAELKQQQPEFMAKLISAARIGRSLGIHLILATQKPSGVVNDQILSNTKFRVCLRVQERSDSMDMLKRPDAASLTNTGRFYLQVGYNEYFALGQSAWCGAAYEPQDTVLVQNDDAIEFLDVAGQVIHKVKPKVKKTDLGIKQIVAVVKYLSDVAYAHGIASRQLWQPELPRALDIDKLQGQAKDSTIGIPVQLGLMDDPEYQRQIPLEINFESCKNILIVGNSGSGKTVLIQDILYLLSKRLAPQDLNFYILDYSSRMMKQLRALPHCGDVLYEEDSDSLDEFFKLINTAVTERKRIFSKLGVESFEAARTKQQLPLILVIIDNITGLNMSKSGEKHYYKLSGYLKDSANYGIKYIITCSHLNEISAKIRNELDDRISLYVKDRYDYNEILGCKVTCLPPEIPGRGLYKQEDRALEFQCAIIQADGDDKSRAAHIQETINALCMQYGNQIEAQRLPVYSDTATYAEFCAQFKPGRIPLGFSKPSGRPIALPLKQFSALSLYFGNRLGTVPVIENLIYAATREGMELWIVKRRENSCFDSNSSGGKGIVQGVPPSAKLFDLERNSLAKLCELLAKEIISRKQLMERYCESSGLDKSAEDIYKTTYSYLRSNTIPVMLLFESFADFCCAIDNTLAVVFNKSFLFAQKRNIYVAAAFEPEDYTQLKSRFVYDNFNQDGNVILLGGKFDKQVLCAISGEYEGKDLPYNVGVMSYRHKCYPILMPCGEVISCEEDEDEESIF